MKITNQYQKSQMNRLGQMGQMYKMGQVGQMKNAPTFKSNVSIVRNDCQEIIYENITRFFKRDLDWNKAVDNLIQKYKNVDKVNMYCYGCSDGSEPYSWAMLLTEKLGKKEAQKFLPIIAKDIDDTVIKNAKSGIVKATSRDVGFIKRFLGENYRKYITFDDKVHRIDGVKVRDGIINPSFKNAVIFEKADIMQDIKNIEPNNSVVVARNFWVYLSEQDQFNLGRKLSNRLRDNSMSIIGVYDVSNAYAKASLLGREFKSTDIEYCYDKMPREAENYLYNPNFLLQSYGHKLRTKNLQAVT